MLPIAQSPSSPLSPSSSTTLSHNNPFPPVISQGGVKHGAGTYTWTTGAVYSGDWLHGCMHGVGTFATADGSCYTGSWATDMKQGLGRKTYPNGDVYEVCWCGCGC